MLRRRSPAATRGCVGCVLEPTEPAAEAFGSPGSPPRWSPEPRDAVGASPHAGGLAWFALARGAVVDVAYPTIDRVQVRGVDFVVGDGRSFVQEARQLPYEVEAFGPGVLGFRVVRRDPHGRYRLIEETLVDPDVPAARVRLTVDGDPAFIGALKVWALVWPQLDGGDWGDCAYLRRHGGQPTLAAHGHETWVVAGADVPIPKRSVGFVGRSDGLQDLLAHRKLTWAFGEALDGHVGLCAELDLGAARAGTFAIAFGASEHHAASRLLQALARPWEETRARFVRGWRDALGDALPLDAHAGDGGRLYRHSLALLRAHEDKVHPGGIVSSFSCPWDERHGDEALGSYQLVWTRDLCHAATGLLAAGDLDTARRALAFLAATQRPDGGFHQSGRIDGRPWHHGVQLDEASHPILLAWRLRQAGGLGGLRPDEMVVAAARYIILNGPATSLERWEENAGFSPSTLAANIAALVCAADFARAGGDDLSADFLLDYADFLESHVEAWTVTTEGSLLPDVPRHYVRIRPADPGDPQPEEDPNEGLVAIRNRPPGDPWEFPVREVVDPGFLELVRYGVRRGDDPDVVASLRVCDALLKVDTPFGPAWRRYNHDGYGETATGEPFRGHGVGRAWPLLAGERGHYALAAGDDPRPYLHALERFAHGAGLLPEQVWDDDPNRLGRPTGAAMPFAWAHAEYVKLLRSVADGAVFDRIGPVAERYGRGLGRRDLEIWKFNRQVWRIAAGGVLRVVAGAPFRLHLTRDGWKTSLDRLSTPTPLGVHYADLATTPGETLPILFTFQWVDSGAWEGKDFQVEVHDPRYVATALPARV